MRVLVLACALACLVSPVPAAAADVAGRVELDIPGVSVEAVSPLVVYLEPLDGSAPAAPGPPAVVHQRHARFRPAFLVVAAGQAVELSNDDAIYHNVFSYSRPNDFDLGLYPAGESRTLRFEHPGAVKLYCSIHESMSATLLVVPTRWSAETGQGGAYSIGGVPPGRYRATLWSERLPLQQRSVEVGIGDLRLDWRVDDEAPDQSP